jgi:glyoxylase-like metal-dependent hydrolase (beta-lactamase superfamily II)
MGEVDFAFWVGQAQPSPAVQQNMVAIRDRFTLLRTNQEIVPGLTTVESFGHTVGHLSVLITSGREKMMAYGDAGGHQILSLRHVGSYLAFDTDGPRAATARQRLFAEAATERYLVTAYHFPFPAIGRIRRREDYFEFVPVVWTW